MKLRAVRLSEVGHFSSGVALEGLSGGFDLLAGPNEMGKSTIFRAIEAVFSEEHKGLGRVVRELAPVSGGAPLIEVDFDSEGHAWRIRKRYLEQKTALLTDLSSGTILRGADAENKFALLKGGRLDRSGLLRLMWVGQQKSVELPAGEVEISKGLARLIEDEIADAGGGGAARRVREAVNLALEKIVSKATRKPSAGKPYKIALDLRDGAKAELESAQVAALQAAKRLSDLEVARAKAENLRSPDAAAARADRLARLRERHAAVIRAEEEFRLATQVVAEMEARHENARGRYERLAGDIAEAARLRASLKSGSEINQQISTEAARLSAAISNLLQSRNTIRVQETQLQSDLEAHDRYERTEMLSRQADELSQRSSVAKATSARIAEIDVGLASDPMTDTVFRELRRANAETDRLEARIAAALPRVRIDYVDGAAGRIRVADGPVMQSGEMASNETLHLDIEGIGRITVSAPAVAQTAGASARISLADAQSHLQSMLERLQVPDMDAAEARHAAWSKLVSEREALVARLAAAAPEGVDQLSLRLANVAAEGCALVSTDRPPQTQRLELQRQLVTARAAIAKLDTDEAAAQAALLEAAKREAHALAEHSTATARLAVLDETLPPANEAATVLIAAAAELDTLAKHLQTAVRDRGAWKAGIPEPALRSELDRDLITAERAIREVELSLHQLAIDIKGLEGALDRDRHDGIEARVVEMQERFDAAEARVAAFATEVRELQLLESLLYEREQERRSTELAPVIARLQHLANGVLPGATFELGDTLRVSGVARSGQTLSPQRLSGGTQEQLAVLVRLAYGRLLADRGLALPLVLDDALVYADDARFSAMIKLLGEASSHHQVVMLTCQAARLRSLGSQLPMTLVELSAWRPD